MNKKLSDLKKKLSLLKISRFTIQLIFLYFFSGLFTLAFTGFKNIYLGLARENFSISNSFTFLAAFAAVIVLSVLIGRFFCGWLCAFGTFNDLVYLVSRKIFKKKINIPQAVGEKLKYIKYIVLLGIIIFMWLMNLSPEKSIDPWDAFAQLPQFKTMASEIPIAFIFLALITIGAMFIERFFCRYLCPLGAIQAILSKIKIINISKPSEKCGKCQLCTENCPMGINLSQVESVKSGECIACLKCVDTCYRSNPKVVIFKKLNMQWYSSTAAAILVFSFIFWGSKLVKPEVNIGTRVSAVQMSKVDEVVFSDGVYNGVGTGFRPNLKVRVKIAKGKISDIKIVSHDETKGYYEQAFDVVPKEIIIAQSTEVDAVSGATKSSSGIKQAVKDALNKARKDKSKNQVVENNENQENSGAAQAESTSTDVSMDKNAKFKDGTYTGVGTGYGTDLTVSVTIKDGKITDIQILSNNETPDFREKAFSVVPNEIITAQSTDVDAVSGATFSSRGIMAAVKNALEKALIGGELAGANTSTTTSTAANNNSVNAPDKVGNLPDNNGTVMVNNNPKDTASSDINNNDAAHNNTGSNSSIGNSNTVNNSNTTNTNQTAGASANSGNNSNTGIVPGNSNTNTGSTNSTGINTGASQNGNSTTSSSEVKYKDGIYTGTGSGYRSNLKLSVIVKDGKIVDIETISNRETEDYYNDAFSTVPKEIISRQSTEVDVVAGATYSSRGIMSAVKAALENAKVQ